MADVENIKKSAWGWLPQLYFIEGLPNAIVGSLSVTYYKSMGMGNTEVAMLTSLLYLPWMLKGFWGPLVDAVSTKRNWIISCLSVFLFAFLALAAAQFFSVWVIASAAVFWILGFASATYDISADGFYMLALDERQQSFFVGIRNAFYRAAVLFGQGAMVVIAGIAQNAFGGGVADGWTVSFLLCAAILLVCLPLFKFTLPQPAEDSPRASAEVGEIFGRIKSAFREFFARREIFSILAFVLLYRFAEAQLTRVVQPFMLDSADCGGLSLSLAEIGLIYGTVAPIVLLCGGILGGIFISRKGLEKSLWTMAAAINLPNIIYVYMAVCKPGSNFLIALLIAVEQFGYGFGFAGYMVFLIFASKGKNKTSNYAICTSLMALGLIFPGLFSGKIQSVLGYSGFFVWVMFATLVSFAVTALALKVVRGKGREIPDKSSNCAG